MSLPLYVRGDTVLPWGAVSDRPDYDWASGVTLRCFALRDSHYSEVVVPAADAGVGASDARVRVRREGGRITVTTDSDRPWAIEAEGKSVTCPAGTREASLEV